MKSTLEFNLTDPDELREHLRCVLSTNMAIVLWEIHNNGFKKVSIEDNDEFNDGVHMAIEYFRDLMEENGININELIG